MNLLRLAYRNVHILKSHTDVSAARLFRIQSESGTASGLNSSLKKVLTSSSQAVERGRSVNW